MDLKIQHGKGESCIKTHIKHEEVFNKINTYIKQRHFSSVVKKAFSIYPN